MRHDLKRKALTASAAFGYVTLAAAPVYASDTEVYVQSAPINAKSAPTLMMVLDTSGSMNWCMDRDLRNASDHCPDGDDRVEVLSKAVKKILLGDKTVSPEVKPAPGYVKMGFTRFTSRSGLGGWVRYPSRPLDAFVEINPNGNVASEGAVGNDDAVQPLSGVTVATGTELLIGGTSNQAAGLRFSGLMMPKGAVVQDAYIELTPKVTDNSPTVWKISIENNSTPADYSAASIDARTYGLSALVDVPAWTANVDTRVTVTELVQTIADRSDWCGANNIAFRIRDDNLVAGTRRAYSFEGAGSTTAYKPRLVVTYLVDPKMTNSCIKLTRSGRSYPVMSDFDDVQWVAPGNPSMKQSYLTPNVISTSNVRTMVGVRLQNIGIPKGADVKKAELVGTVRRAITAKPTQVAAYNVDNFPAICSGSSSSPSCAIPTSTLMTAVEVPAKAYVANSSFTADVTDQVKSIIARPGWAAGNAMGFRLTNSSTAKADTGGLELFDANNNIAKAFTLLVSWEEVVTDLSKLQTVRDDLLAEITPASLNVTGGTPLGAAYAEASLYMYGMQTSHVYSTAATGESAFIDPRTVDSSKNYISPIKDENKCGADYIMLMTDGDPNDEGNIEAISPKILKRNCPNMTSLSGAALNWSCMFDLAQYNASPNNPNGSRLRTNTVLFGPLAGASATNMKKMADLGQGNYYKAGDEAALVNALNETLNALISAGNSVAAPGVAVNQLNKLSHLDQLYYAAFDPEPQKSRWEGNIKRYRLDLANEQIKDADSENAVDPATGFFRDGSRSYWSAAEDGSRAVEGGAAALLVPNQRTQYTYLGALSAKNQSLNRIDLASSSFNTAAKPMTGATTDTEYKNLMYWYQGYVVPNLTDAMSITTSSLTRNRMGAGLHSKPVLINYGYTGTTANAGIADNQYNYLFFSTLEGTLHAIEAKTGIEKFSFIPGEKLSSLRTLYDNDVASLPQMGMDLSWTVYRKDANFDNQIGSGDKVYIYGGMRMGGKNYYALDVTDLNAPKLLFAINGGSTTNSNRFLRMGQTWSQPALGNIKIGSTVKTVLVFGGGYDPRHETAGKIYTDNDLGNQLYIVDAVDGTLYWSASGTSTDNPYKSVPEMKYSVPTAPKLVDFNGDGLTDTIYFGDLGGQLFRVDLNNGQAAADIAKRVRLIAKFGQTVTADTANQRRFYEPATAALFEDVDNINNGRLFAAVAFGSGYRSHPLDTGTSDRFYSILDFDVTRSDLLTIAENASSLRAPLTISDLSKINLTSNAGADKTKQGFYIDLIDEGEKSMAQGLIINNELIFTTYVPSMVAGDSCSPVIGRTKLYRQCMPYGGIGDTCNWEGDRVQDNVMIGIGGEPQYLFQNTTSASGTTIIEGGLVVGSSVIGDGEYERKMKRLHRFREKRN